MKFILKGIAQLNYVLSDYKRELNEEELETLRQARNVLQRLWNAHSKEEDV